MTHILAHPIHASVLGHLAQNRQVVRRELHCHWLQWDGHLDARLAVGGGDFAANAVLIFGSICQRERVQTVPVALCHQYVSKAKLNLLVSVSHLREHSSACSRRRSEQFPIVGMHGEVKSFEFHFCIIYPRVIFVKPKGKLPSGNL